MLSIRDIWLLITPFLILGASFIIPGYFINRMKKGQLRNILGAIFILFWFIAFVAPQIYFNVLRGGR
ncbi:hypothetical protein [Paenibacillus sp. IHBB 3054]|uniref:hypothetical protein n=1 Tax=Paenibacillus sp. IHBB 3054 TaxID=3425689 RepID=UPI003F668B85